MGPVMDRIHEFGNVNYLHSAGQALFFQGGLYILIESSWLSLEPGPNIPGFVLAGLVRNGSMVGRDVFGPSYRAASSFS
ncbi:hypothetical protein ZOSMA_269G00100 [Zostera marina]|uniref:Uncharacterized protein n=1 Tax=Zostera marina TaxID=29655 RepID=A0A0K9PEM0_ZOSMR|nr:hypothetical protein ZOSMA_269G00100 [Zostera marina]